jgi:TolB protein
VTNTPTPGNAATATLVALDAQARAFTTGTPTPYPADAVVLVATPTSAPASKNSPTPIFVLLEDLSPTRTPTATPDFPPELTGKIAFKANFLGSDRRPDYMIMNPDGTGVARLTSAAYYQRAAERDHYSGDRRFYASVSREQDGFRRIQIFYDFIEYGTKRQLTFFGAGAAWDPAWSPVDDTVVLVSNDSRNDEIWVMQRDEWPAVKLTNNDWEWDNHPSFSPDGSQIVFMSNRIGGKRQLWIMDRDGGNQRQLTSFPFEVWDPVWIKYPDG